MSQLLGRPGETNLRVTVVEHGVILAHEDVAEDPERPRRLRDVHAHDGQDTHLVVTGADHVLVAL